MDGDPTIDKTLRVSGIDARRADEKLQIMLQHETESYELVRGDDLEVSGARLLEAALRVSHFSYTLRLCCSRKWTAASSSDE